ncbi:MtrB/PioB family decaheme-associated outer membrane protein [Kaarinaea lacus]
MKTRTHLPFSFFLLGGSSFVYADDNTDRENTNVVQPEQWQCQYCEFELGITSSLEAGVGYISDDSFKFGEYNGLYKKGAYAIGNFESRYRNYNNANFWNVDATDLGLETRSFSVKGGKQGLYELSLRYNELPHFISDTARTPFNGNGSNRLTLPAGWVYGGTTTDMSALDSNLKQIDLKTKRTQLEFGASYIPRPQWKTSIDYRHEIREGKKRIAGSFYFNSAEMIEPVDYTSDTIDLFAAYTTRAWQATLAYHGSLFKNNDDSLTWQNPYLPIVAGADEGQLSLPPDNQFHQVRGSIALQIADSSKLMADVALGRMTQNDDFLAPTVNTMLTVSPLPVNSLDGRVDTINANVKWNTQFNENLSANAVYRYSDRDNKTPQHTYEWVTTDTNVATPLTNIPYSYTRNTLNVSGEYRLTPGTKTMLGYDYQQYERTFQEVEKSTEQTLWASFLSHAPENVDVLFRLARADRDIDGYQVIAGVDSPQNPLMRKYNMADRQRDQLDTRIDFLATEQTNIGFNINFAKDRYSDSNIGLTASQESTFGFDISMRLAMDTSVDLFVSMEEISSNVSGSQLYDIPDWSGSVNDRFNSTGVNFSHSLLRNKLDIGFGYTYTYSVGGITIDAGTSSPLPDLKTVINSFKLYGNYHVNESMTINGTYWYEDYASDDWAFDNVNENTIPNNLSLGQESPSYNVNVAMVSLRYKF